jgi:hypothetical protein
VIQRQNYLALVDLLDNPESARVLYHAATIDDLAIQTLPELPPSLRRRLSSAVPDWPRTLNGLTQSLQFLVSRGVNSSRWRPLRPGRNWRRWLGNGSGACLCQGTIPPRRIGNARRLDSGKEVCSLAKTWHNCLGSYTDSIDAGHSAVYVWEDVDKPAACLVRRRDRLGWFLDEVKGPRNGELDPDQVEVIAAAFAKAGVPRSSAVSAIENILYVDPEMLQ